MHHTSSNIGAYIKTAGASNAAQGFTPEALAAGTDYGNSFSIEGARSCTLTGLTGAATGGPTSYSVAYSLQVSADQAFTTPVDVASSTVTLTADDKASEVDINLQGLAAGYYYARVKAVVTMNGGTSPKALCAAQVTLGGYERLPV
jgi:hypothetical protein